jgi:hypothetical protein
MKKLLLIITILIASTTLAQTIKRYSGYCFEGYPVNGEIKWNDSFECKNHTIIIKDKKIKINYKLKIQRFKILEYSGFETTKEYVRNTWKCFDYRNREECFIYHLVSPKDLPIEEIYIEYTDVIYCFKVRVKKFK